MPSPKVLPELAAVFLKIGGLSFGGPAAHIAMMEEEIVRRRGWLSREAFLDILGAVNLIPGPNSTEVALHVGLIRGGLLGLLVAGCAVIAPAFVCVLTLAWLYEIGGARPEPASVLEGIRPVVAAVVMHALLRLGKSAWDRPSTLVLGLFSLAAALVFEASDVSIVLVAGVVAVAWERGSRGGATAPLLPLVPLAPAALASAPAVTPTGLFLVFLKIGGTLFGSGYVLLSYLRAELVVRLGWIDESRLMDAIAVGQMTPGPLFTSATFVGYQLDGIRGAIVSTVGIFLPAFVLVSLSGPLIPRLRRSSSASAFLRGVNAASVALMAAVSLQLGRGFVTDPFEGTIFAASAVLLIRFGWDSTRLIIAGGILGWMRSLI